MAMHMVETSDIINGELVVEKIFFENFTWALSYALEAILTAVSVKIYDNEGTVVHSASNSIASSLYAHAPLASFSPTPGLVAAPQKDWPKWPPHSRN